MLFSSRSTHGLTTLALVLCAALFLQGCDSTGTSEPSEPEGTKINLSEQTAHGLHEDFAEMANKVPGFGGYFLDEDGRPTVYLMEPDSSRRDEVRGALTEVFGDDALSFEDNPRRSGSPEVQLKEGRYRMTDLLSWYDRLPEVLEVDGAIMVDLHERANNLTVGVQTPEASDRVREKLTELEIPNEAVEIVERELPTPNSNTLRDRFRPTMGGTEIGQIGSNILCTMGFNVFYNGTAGFITNSHCTAQRGGVGTSFSNPSGGGRLGQETVDPNYNTCYGVLSCRKSDAAFIKYNSGVKRDYEIARTRSWSASGSGTLKINHGNSSLDVTGADSHPVSGEIVDKVGRTTGWTYDSVDRTCFGTFSGNGNGGTATVNGKPVYMRCQYEADLSGAGGDSGSPVFDWHGDTVTLYGVFWGGSGTFSPWQGIVKDF